MDVPAEHYHPSRTTRFDAGTPVLTAIESTRLRLISDLLADGMITDGVADASSMQEPAGTIMVTVQVVAWRRPADAVALSAPIPVSEPGPAEPEPLDMSVDLPFDVEAEAWSILHPGEALPPA